MAQPTSTIPQLGSGTVLGDALALPLAPGGNPANAACPIDLRADPWPGGRRVDLFWRNPDDVRWVLIRRATTASPPVPNAPSEVLYFGGPIEHFIDGAKVAATFGYPGGEQTPPLLEAGVQATGVPLEEETLYHYSVFLSRAIDPPGVRDFGDARACNQVAGLSIQDYVAHEGEWVYRNHIPAEARELDAQSAAATGRSIGLMRAYCRFIQGGLDLARGLAAVTAKLGDPARMAAGLVGRARRHSDNLALWFRLFALPPERYSLDLDVLRRVGIVGVRLAQLKGTCAGLCELVKAVTLWDCECLSAAAGPCNPKTLKTWGGSKKQVVSYPLSLVEVSPGKFVLPAPVLEAAKFNGGWVSSWTWSYHLTDTNTATTVVLRGTNEVVSVEDLLTIDAVAPGVDPDTYVLTVTRTAGGAPTINDNEWSGGTLLAANNRPGLVLSSENPSTVIVHSPLGAPNVGAAAVAASYIVGATFADRDPEFRVTLRSPCASTLWHPNKPTGNHKLYAGGLLLGLDVKPGDLVLPVTTPWATLARGEATAVDPTTITDTNNDFGPANSLVGTLLCPNVRSPIVYEVVSNTSTSLSVLPPAGISLAEVAIIGSNYALFDRAQARLFDAAHRLARYYAPSGSKVILTFPTE